MSPRIVVVPPTHADIAEMAKKMAPSGFELVVSRADRAALEQVLPAAEYLVCYPNVRLDDALYKLAPKLRLYQLLSAGYDDVDLEAARRAKVPVCNNGGANAISVSEHAIMPC
jgi:lactate dehydrogenase-like 2-hydroxyacid dehydrogenase